MDGDLELLEMAAKAAGIRIAYSDELGVVPEGTREDGPRRGTWNPLADDGDALRLAVKLRLHLGLEDHAATAWSTKHRNSFAGEPIDDNHSSDESTRRAIVRAAAEIGKAMP